MIRLGQERYRTGFPAISLKPLRQTQTLLKPKPKLDATSLVWLGNVLKLLPAHISNL